jgi:hypothetical protein
MLPERKEPMRVSKWDKQAIVKSIMADVPMPDKTKRRAEVQAEVVKLMSPECRKVYKITPDALVTLHLGDVIYDGHRWDHRSVVAGNVTESQVQQLVKKYKDEDQKFYAVRDQLKATVDSCSTVKQLNDRLPEFKKYFPTIEKPVANLPATANLVADLTKLGWPKGAKQSK